MYTAGICAIVSKANRFIDDMKYVICQEKHSFNKYPILLDNPYLKKHFIAYCLLWNRTQKQMNLAVKRIQDSTIDNTGDNDDIVSDDSNTTDDGQDFFNSHSGNPSYHFVSSAVVSTNESKSVSRLIANSLSVPKLYPRSKAKFIPNPVAVTVSKSVSKLIPNFVSNSKT